MNSPPVGCLLLALALLLGMNLPNVQAAAISLGSSDTMVSATPRVSHGDQVVSDYYFNITDGQLAYSDIRNFVAENFDASASIDWSYNFAFLTNLITATSSVSSRTVASDNVESAVDGGTSYTLSFTTTQKTKFTMIGSSSVSLEANVDIGDWNQANTDFSLVGFGNDNRFDFIAGKYSQVHLGSKSSTYFKSGILKPSTYLFRSSSYIQNGAFYPGMAVSSNTSFQVRLYLEAIPEPNAFCLIVLNQGLFHALLGRTLGYTHPR